jgi:ChrR Cupin-like domain
MNYLHYLCIVASGLVCSAGCGSDEDSTAVQGLSSDKAVLDLDDVKTSPSTYDWFDFRPNVKKLILSGAAETEHVAILWYTVTDGSVGLHYHSKTESVYVIDGTQTDAKGLYPTGTVYFNPPGSGHQITDSSGFFILAYASPPDFASTDLIEEYTPVRIDTTDPNLMNESALEQDETGVRRFEAPLNSAGGMSAEFIEVTAPESEHEYRGNYLLVLQGSCDIEGMTLGEQMLVVASTVAPQPFKVIASEGSSCLAMGVSF